MNMNTNNTQPMTGVKGNQPNATFWNVLTCCCCNSKDYPNDPNKWLKSFFAVNIFYGWMSLGLITFHLYGQLLVLLSFIISLTGWFMVNKGPGQYNPTVIKSFLWITLLFNLLGLQLTGILWFILFIFTVAMFGAHGLLTSLEKLIPQLSKTETRASGNTFGFGIFFLVVSSFFGYIYLVILIQALNHLRAMDKCEEASNPDLNSSFMTEISSNPHAKQNPNYN